MGGAEPAVTVVGGCRGRGGARCRWVIRGWQARGVGVLVHAVQKALDDTEGYEAADVDVC